MDEEPEVFNPEQVENPPLNADKFPEPVSVREDAITDPRVALAAIVTPFTEDEEEDTQPMTIEGL